MRRVYIQAKELYGVLFAKYATHINSTVDLGLNREKRRGRFANCRATGPPGLAYVATWAAGTVGGSLLGCGRLSWAGWLPP